MDNNDNQLLLILVGIAGLVVGLLISYFLLKKAMKSKVEDSERKARSIIKDAESDADVMKKNKILEAKEKFLQLKSDHEKAITEKDKNINAAENRVKQKEATLAQKIEQTQRKQSEFDHQQATLKNQLEILEAKKEEVSKLHSRQVE